MAIIETAFAHECHALSVILLGHDSAEPHMARTYGTSNDWKYNFLDMCADARCVLDDHVFRREGRLKRVPSHHAQGTGVDRAGLLERLELISFCNAPCQSGQK